MLSLVGETYWELFRNRPHWLFELTVEIATFIVATLPIRWWVRRHDLDHPTMVEFKKLQQRVVDLERKLEVRTGKIN